MLNFNQATLCIDVLRKVKHVHSCLQDQDATPSQDLATNKVLLIVHVNKQKCFTNVFFFSTWHLSFLNIAGSTCNISK